MSNILFQAHSGWRYVVIIVAVLVLIKYLIGWLGNRQWSSIDQKLGMAFPIVIDIQWTLGLVLWLTGLSTWFMGRNVTSWEHLVTMTLALIVAHVGWARVKKTDDAATKFRTGFLFFLVASLLVGLGVMRITSMS
ncbi:MAG: cytochrome B [Caldilineaceae bacterium]|nr:cytochrome B [Caldilineaceae bacterium]